MGAPLGNQNAKRGAGPKAHSTHPTGNTSKIKPVEKQSFKEWSANRADRTAHHTKGGYGFHSKH